LNVTPNIDDIVAAAARIRPFARHTPVITSSGLDDMFGCRVSFKCENLQKTGAFKFRGACNAVLSLADVSRGVATHSSGNHAAALTLAARLRGARAVVVMPRGSSRTKMAAVEHYGGRIVECPATHEGRARGLEKVIEEHGCAAVPPYDDVHVIAGQGTAMLELAAQVDDLDLVLAPLGGGGLLSGTLIAARARMPGVRVVGVEPSAADDARRSLDIGHIVTDVVPDTIADGLRTRVGDLTFPIIQGLIDDVVTVSESAIVQTMRLLWQRLKLIIEPSAAVPMAALLEHRISVRGRRVGIILSGGNVDLDALPWSAPR